MQTAKNGERPRGEVKEGSEDGKGGQTQRNVMRIGIREVTIPERSANNHDNKERHAVHEEMLAVQVPRTESSTEHKHCPADRCPIAST